MSDTSYPFGKPVKLLVDMQGYQDGRVIQFEIFRKKTGGEEKIAEVFGSVKNDKGVGYWSIGGQELNARADSLQLKQQIIDSSAEEKFYFKAKIEDKEVESESFVFSYNLQLYLKDEQDKPLDGVKCKITFSNGQSEEALLKKGLASFSAAPPGKFKIELDGYEFVLTRPPVPTYLEKRTEERKQ
jgi:hypothetical protein